MANTLDFPDIVSVDGLHVKLRRAADNAKVPRRPSHIELAIRALLQEYMDLCGPEDTCHNVIPQLLADIATERANGSEVFDPLTASAIVGNAVEGLVNMPQRFKNGDDPTAEGVGRLIAQEVADIFEDRDLGVNLTEALRK